MRDGDGNTPLILAAGSAPEAAMVLLRQRRTDVAAANEFGVTALHRAARAGHLRVLQRLLQRGADPHALTMSGEPPLALAPNLATAKLLLKRGARLPETTFSGGETGLHRLVGLGPRAGTVATALWDASQGARALINARNSVRGPSADELATTPAHTRMRALAAAQKFAPARLSCAVHPPAC